MVLVCLLVLLPTSGADAKARSNKLSVTQKTLTEGKKCTIRLKKEGKVKWKSSNKAVAALQKKRGNRAVILAKKKGKATVTAICKGRKYHCKVVVKARTDKPKIDSEASGSKKGDKPVLNAKEVSIYYRSADYDDILPVNAAHDNSFRFRVFGTKKEVEKWELAGEDKEYFDITQYGLVSMKFGTVYQEPCADVMVKVTLTDHTVLTAVVKGFNETNLYIDKLFEHFKDTYIMPDMTEKEMADRAAGYIGKISDYESGNSDWRNIFLRGRGDCSASRFAMEVLCQYLGIKAQGCNSFEAHGKTVVYADGIYYVYTTGYNEPKPRTYMVSEISYEKLSLLADELGVWMGYFGK